MEEEKRSQSGVSNRQSSVGRYHVWSLERMLHGGYLGRIRNAAIQRGQGGNRTNREWISERHGGGWRNDSWGEPVERGRLNLKEVPENRLR
jgi:hypothetical protein